MPVITSNSNDSHFCPLPWNFNDKTYKTSIDTAAPNLIDGRTDTFEGPGAGIYIVADTTAQITTHLYIVASGVTQFTITGHPVGTNIDGSPHTVTDTNYTVTKKNGQETRYTLGGLSHYMFELNRASGVLGWFATSIQINVTGATARVYEVAAMHSIFRLDADSYYTRIDFNPREPQSVTYRNIYGDESKALLAGVPVKWTLNAEYEFKRTDSISNPNIDDLVYFFHANPNFSFIPLYREYPDKVFTRAIVPADELRTFRTNTIRYQNRIPIAIRQA